MSDAASGARQIGAGALSRLIREKVPAMRFMFILHAEPNGTAPPPALREAMHAMAAREVAAGRMIADGGLLPPQMGAQVRLKSGRLVVTDGPFAETKEVMGGFAIFELPDMAAAIKSAEMF